VGGSLHQLDTHLALELLQGSCQRRLRDVQRLGRPRQIQRIGDRQKCPDVA
jgi:hypothetical protein